MASKRENDLIIELRLNELEYEMLRGMRTNMVYQYFGKKWNISTAQLDNYIAAVKERWKKNNEKTQDEYRREVLEMWFQLYRDAIADSDKKQAAEALKQIQKITGADAPIKLDITGEWKLDFNTTILSEETDESGDTQ